MTDPVFTQYPTVILKTIVADRSMRDSSTNEVKDDEGVVLDNKIASDILIINAMSSNQLLATNGEYTINSI